MSLFGLLKSKNSEQEVSAESKQEEIIQEEKQDMIEGVEGLSSTTVKEVMIPRIDVDFIPNDCSKEELIEKIITSGLFLCCTRLYNTIYFCCIDCGSYCFEG